MLVARRISSQPVSSRAVPGVFGPGRYPGLPWSEDSWFTPVQFLGGPGGLEHLIAFRGLDALVDE